MTPFQKFIVTAYRYLAAAVLMSILSTGIGYALITVFYTVNSSWAAPVIISQTHERILQLQAELFRSKQAMGTLEAEQQGLNAETAVLKAEESTLVALLAKVQTAQSQQQKDDQHFAATMAPLSKAKAADITRTSQVVESLAKQDTNVAAELAAGLITKDEAAARRAAFNSLKVAATDSAVVGVTLNRTVAQMQHSADTLKGGQGSSATALDLLSRVAQLESQLAHVRLKINQNNLIVNNKAAELAKLKAIVATLSDSPYYRVTVATSPLSFAFVPYSNEDGIKAGEGVYDCTFQVLWCKKVGVVKKVHHDEERAQHPLFHVDMRGSLVEMELTDQQAGKSRVVFIGRAPLFL